MEITTKVSGKNAKNMDMDQINFQMEISIKGNILMGFQMGMENTFGKMDHTIREILNKEKKKAKAFYIRFHRYKKINGTHMKDNFQMIRKMDMLR